MMAAPNGIIPPGAQLKHLFVTLKVDLFKLKDAPPRKLVIFKVDPRELIKLTSDDEDESMESSEEEQEQVELPLQDHDTPLIRFRHKSDLIQPRASLLSTRNTILYRPHISDPLLFQKYLNRQPDLFAQFKGLYFYIDYPASAVELEEAVMHWSELFQHIGREAGWVDHVEVVWGKHWIVDHPNPLGMDRVVLEALGGIEVERFVRILGAYEKGVVEGVLEGMGVESDAWMGFQWG